MQDLLKEKAIQVYGGPVNSSKECNCLSEQIFIKTNRKVSPTTLRRFFGLLPTRSSFSNYVLDTLAIYCGSEDFRKFCRKLHSFDDYAIQQRLDIISEMDQITEYSLNSVSRKSLCDFNLTIPRKAINDELGTFVDSSFTIFPMIAPGGYGKSIALAHWTRIQQRENVCLFCSASMFYSMLDPNTPTKKPLQFQLNSWGNVFNVFLNDMQLRNRKLLIIIDALEEIGPDPVKLLYLVDYMFDVSHRYSFQNKIKIIFSTRESIWQNHLASRFEKVMPKNWFDEIGPVFGSSFANRFSYSSSEIREIITLFNRTVKVPLVFDCIPWNIRELIKIPINLYFIIVLISKKVSLEAISQNDVIKEFMKEIVFCSRYAEQMEDLIWKVIELIETRKGYLPVAKNELKNSYPIHLKREIAYYQAYNDLLENGVLQEYREENKYGIFVSKIVFKHLNFYFYLSALNNIRENDGLNADLFITISKAEHGESWASNLIATFFQIAYDNEDLESLKDFCELPEYILGSFVVIMAVGTCFRKENSIRDEVIKVFAASSVGRKLFFEQFVDTNYLTNNYNSRIREYLKYAETNEQLLFGNSIQYLSGFLSLDKDTCRKHFSIIEKIGSNENIYPWPLGRKVSGYILHKYFVQKTEIDDLEGYINNISKFAYAYPGYLNRGLIEFELYIMLALVLVQEFELLALILTNVFNHYNTSNVDSEEPVALRSNQNSLPRYFLEYALFKNGSKYHPGLPGLWESAIDNYTASFDDYQYLIFLNWFLCDYWFSTGEPDKSMKHFNAALMLSRFARYDFYTAFLLKNDPSGDPDHIAQADQLIADSGFGSKRFIFQFGPSVAQ